jgi:hypothetical protein
MSPLTASFPVAVVDTAPLVDPFVEFIFGKCLMCPQSWLLRRSIKWRSTSTTLNDGIRPTTCATAALLAQVLRSASASTWMLTTPDGGAEKASMPPPAQALVSAYKQDCDDAPCNVCGKLLRLDRTRRLRLTMRLRVVVVVGGDVELARKDAVDSGGRAGPGNRAKASAASSI